MSILQLHIEEEIEAQRRDFLAWWETNIRPGIPIGDNKTEAVSRNTHWSKWLYDHHYTKPK